MNLSSTAINGLPAKSPLNVRLNDKANEITTLTVMKSEIFLNTCFERLARWLRMAGMVYAYGSHKVDSYK